MFQELPGQRPAYKVLGLYACGQGGGAVGGVRVEADAEQKQGIQGEREKLIQEGGAGHEEGCAETDGLGRQLLRTDINV